MDNGNGYDVSTVLLVEVVKVRGMLEIVCVDFTVFNNVVRLNVIRELFDVECNALCCKDFLCNVKNLFVRSGRSGNRDRCALECIVIYR